MTVSAKYTCGFNIVKSLITSVAAAVQYNVLIVEHKTNFLLKT